MEDRKINAERYIDCVKAVLFRKPGMTGPDVSLETGTLDNKSVNSILYNNYELFERRGFKGKTQAPLWFLTSKAHDAMELSSLDFGRLKDLCALFPKDVARRSSFTNARGWLCHLEQKYPDLFPKTALSEIIENDRFFAILKVSGIKQYKLPGSTKANAVAAVFEAFADDMEKLLPTGPNFEALAQLKEMPKFSWFRDNGWTVGACCLCDGLLMMNVGKCPDCDNSVSTHYALYMKYTDVYGFVPQFGSEEPVGFRSKSGSIFSPEMNRFEKKTVAVETLQTQYGLMTITPATEQTFADQQSSGSEWLCCVCGFICQARYSTCPCGHQPVANSKQMGTYDNITWYYRFSTGIMAHKSIRKTPIYDEDGVLQPVPSHYWTPNRQIRGNKAGKKLREKGLLPPISEEHKKQMALEAQVAKQKKDLAFLLKAAKTKQEAERSKDQFTKQKVLAKMSVAESKKLGQQKREDDLMEREIANLRRRQMEKAYDQKAKKHLEKHANRKELMAAAEAVQKRMEKGKFAPKLGVGLLTEAVQSVMLPEDAEPVRFAEGMSTQPTVLASLRNKTSMTLGTGTMLQSNCSLAFSFYNPLRASVIFDQNAASQSWSYQAYFTPGTQRAYGVTSAVNAVSASMSSLVGFTAASPVKLDFAYMLSSSNYQPHGPVMFCGRNSDESRTFIPLTSSDTCILNVSMASGTTAFVFGMRVFAYNGNGLCNYIGTINQNSGFAAPRTGYYAFEIYVYTTGSADAVMQTSFNVSNNYSVWCHKSVPDIFGHASQIRTLRVLAHAIRYNNVVAAQYKQGTAVSIMAPPGADWMNFATVTCFDDLVKAKDSEILEFNHGAYTFGRPADLTTFEFREYFNCLAGSLTASYYPLNETSPFCVLCVNVTDPTGSGANIYVTHSLEYTTTDTWLDTMKPELRSDVWEEVFRAIGQTKLLYENTFHWAEIGNWIKKAVPWITKNVPEIVERYGPLAEAAVALL